MDTKNIFIAATTMLRKADWEKDSNKNEWSFTGEAKDFQLDSIQNRINQFFQNELSLYLVVGRHNSKEIIKESAANEVKFALSDKDVILCNTEFKRFIVFNHIGVAKQGEYSS